MKRKSYSLAILAGTLLALGINVVSRSSPSGGQTVSKWTIHDRSRPLPPVITPGETSTQDHPGQPPSDAIVLFNGKDLSNWESVKGGEAKWKVGDGYFEVASGTGDIQTKQGYGDCQLHVEWATPNPPRGKDQDRGNSGVFLHGLYEIQVLDSYQSVTYADGEAAAVYGQFPPLVNACRPPGQWQTYDIVFHGARFDAAGVLLRRATVTVIQNEVLVQDHVKMMGPTAHMHRPPYEAAAEKLPLGLQDHNHPVRYRNLWLREIPEEQP
jgi:3-keto-disaccharide hydrolase